MCEGFGVVVTKDGQYLFCEPTDGNNCERHVILQRAGIKGNTDQFKRNFVRVQFSDWTAGSFEFDENDSLPGWVDEGEVKNRCCNLLERVAPALAEYEKVLAPAYAEYEKAEAPALAEYEKVRDAAWAEFVKSISTIEGYVK